MMQNSDIVYGSLFMRAQKIVKDAQVLFFTPPMIPGYSASSDIELNMQDKTGGNLDRFFDISKEYMAALTARPEIKSAQTTFNPNFPQYEIDIDAAACKKAGISPKDILSTLQGYYGGLYASNFNRFGKMYRVMVQADPDLRKNMESMKNIKVKSGNDMAPISQFITMKKVYGPDIISRFNMYTAIKVMVAPADGYTSGQALKAIDEVAKTTLPAGFDYELGGMAREEASTSGSTTALIFLLCFVFVYLLLSAQYESYILPLSVLLSVPFGLMGSFLFVQGWAALGNIPALKMIVGTMSNNIYMQIALIMLVGLLAKNAILIVEFARDFRKEGNPIRDSALEAGHVRLRPILMTSFAFVLGVMPLLFATGAGAASRISLGAAVVFGMRVKERTATLVAAIDSMRDGFGLLNRDGNFSLLNHRLLEFVNLESQVQTLTREDFIRAVQKKNPDSVEAVIKMLSEPNTTFALVESDDKVWLLSSFAVKEESALIGMGVVVRDITEAHKLDVMKNSLISVAAHEFKTPLASLRMQAETLARKDVAWTKEMQSELIDGLVEDIDRLQTLVRDWLDLSRIEAGAIGCRRCDSCN